MPNDARTISTTLDVVKLRNLLEQFEGEVDEQAAKAVHTIRDFLEGCYWDETSIAGMVYDLNIFREDHIEDAYQPRALLVIGLLTLLYPGVSDCRKPPLQYQ